MSKIDNIFNALQNRIDSGELTLEAANDVYQKALAKYEEENEVTESVDDLTIDEVAEYIESVKSEIYMAYFNGDITVEESEMLLSVIDPDTFVTEAADDNDIPEGAKKDIDPKAKKKQLIKKAALGAAAAGAIAGTAGLAYGIKSGKIDMEKIGKKVKDSTANVKNAVTGAGKKVTDGAKNASNKVGSQVKSTAAKLKGLVPKKKEKE